MKLCSSKLQLTSMFVVRGSPFIGKVDWTNTNENEKARSCHYSFWDRSLLGFVHKGKD